MNETENSIGGYDKKFVISMMIEEKDGFLFRRFLSNNKTLNSSFEEVCKFFRSNLEVITQIQRIRYGKEVDNSSLLKALANPKAHLEQSQPFVWYLNYLIKNIRNELKGKRNDNYGIYLKACKEFVFAGAFRDKSNKKATQKEVEWIRNPVFESLLGTNENTVNIKIKPSSAQVRGMMDMLFFLSPHIKKIIQKEKNEFRLSQILADIFSWWKWEADIVKYTTDKKGSNFVLKLRVNVICYDDKFSLQKKTIQYPVYEKDTLVSSISVRWAIYELSKIWVNMLSKNAIICAPPGSGKEVMKDILLVAVSKEQPYQIAINMAAKTTDQIEAEIAESFTAYNLFNNPPTTEKKAFFFFDEIHESSEESRSWLHRFLENDELTIKGRTIKLSDKTFSFFATSLTLKDVEKLEPVDFWTRIENKIEMNHPFDMTYHAISDRKDAGKEVIRDYFCLFWIISFKKMEKMTKKGDWILDELRKLTSNTIIKKLSEIFEDVISNHGPEKISIRNIRTIVMSLWGKWRSHVIVAQGEVKTELNNEQMDQFKQWVNDTMKITVKI